MFICKKYLYDKQLKDNIDYYIMRLLANITSNMLHVKQSYKHIIADLREHMFFFRDSNETITKQLNNISQTSPPTLQIPSTILYPHKTFQTKQIKAKEKENKTRYYPRQKDTLFWCFYILKHGYSNYEMELSGQSIFAVEKQAKFAYIEKLRLNKRLLKEHKIKPLTELEDDLANKECIGLKTFFSLCLLEELGVIVVNGRKVYGSKQLKEDKVTVIKRDNDKTYLPYYIELDTTEEMVKMYLTEYYQMGISGDGLKANSAYKVEELKTIVAQL